MSTIKITGKVNSAICYAKVVEEEALDQIKRMCDSPMSEGSKIRIMPDVHSGKGCTIGTTMTITDKHQYDLVIKSANQYNFYRNMILGEENMEAINKKRKFYQDIFIDMLDQYADSIEEETAHKVAWRVALGSDKQKLGDFAEYISHVTFIRKDML